MRSTGHKGLIRKHPRERYEVTLAQASALEAPQQNKSGINEQLREVVRTRHVLKPSLGRDTVNVVGGRLCFEEDRGGGSGMGREGLGWVEVGWVGLGVGLMSLWCTQQCQLP